MMRSMVGGTRLMALAVGLMLAGCAGSGAGAPDDGVDTGAKSGGVLSWLTPQRNTEQEQKNLQDFAVVAICPRVQVKDGTQLYQVAGPGKAGTPGDLRFQATVLQFARECHTDPTTGATTIKVGVAGRMLAGRNGATGSASLPLRVALLRNGDDVLFSQLYPVAATVAPGTGSTDWAKVVDGITVPREKSGGNLVIYVGFDGGTSKVD